MGEWLLKKKPNRKFQITSVEDSHGRLQEVIADESLRLFR